MVKVDGFVFGCAVLACSLGAGIASGASYDYCPPAENYYVFCQPDAGNSRIPDGFDTFGSQSCHTNQGCANAIATGATCTSSRCRLTCSTDNQCRTALGVTAAFCDYQGSPHYTNVCHVRCSSDQDCLTSLGPGTRCGRYDGEDVCQILRVQHYLDAQCDPAPPQCEAIDSIQDASIIPETFYPALSLTFTDLAEGAGYENAFGWYNVGDDTSLPENRHLIIEWDREPPYTTTVSLCGDPNWKGGPIGFFIISPDRCSSCNNHGLNDDPGVIYYTEPRLNLAESNPETPFIHHLIYQSTLDPTSFYFGFEDLYEGGDNDYEDILILVEGLLVDAPVEDCNGLDDDCDGDIDENVTRPCSTVCGEGVQYCIGPDTWGACTAPTPQAEECNGEDDNCDGFVDEGLTSPCGNAHCPGVMVCVGGIYDPDTCTARPAVEEVCDNTDNDCDGQIDEEIAPRVCSSDCGAGLEFCEHGSWVDCTAPQPEMEICDGVDNDCDGATDELDPLPCNNGCPQNGWRYCDPVAGDWTECDAPSPGPEICDGLDNNCNNMVDEPWPQLGNNCVATMGFCVDHYGVYVCNATMDGVVCQGNFDIQPEACNGYDDDCNGLVDEDDPLLHAPCGACEGAEQPPCDWIDEGECGPGEILCIDGRLECRGEITPADEICDGLDNNCDGSTDEGFEDEPEICFDGVDNDCDGLTDEGCGGVCEPGSTEPCGTDEGECATGIRICDAFGSWGECQGGIWPTDEVCDELDNDCDGLTDEDAVPEICDDGIDNDCDGFIDSLDSDCGECTPGDTRPCGSDVGECRPGVQACNAQARWGECGGEVGPEPERCDGLDNDCDGVVDEGDLCSGYDICLCGECVSACQAGECPSGDRICVNGWCVSDACCGVSCPPGEECIPESGRCADRCVTQAVECEPGQVCRMGECVDIDCFEEGCPPGERCVAGACQPDPCYGVECADDEYCHAGECLAVACADCGPDESCIDGQCVADDCAGVSCEQGQTCIDGICAADPCQGVYCNVGWTCQDGQCVADPCRDLVCPDDSHCQDGHCVSDRPELPDGGTDGGDGGRPDAGGDKPGADAGGADAGTSRDGDSMDEETSPGRMSGGCECSASGSAAGWWPLVLLGIGAVVRRRRKAGRSLWLVLLAAAWLPTLVGCISEVAPTDAGLSCRSSADCAPGYRCRLGACVPGENCSDFDNDGYCDAREGYDDCNDNRPEIFPGAPELCDGLDNDCDGETDEICDCAPGEQAPCGTEVGVCRRGVKTCEYGYWGACVGGRTPDASESCDDGLDNDCDGAVDEGCPGCPPNASRPCGVNTGECEYGIQVCQDTAGAWIWSPCMGGSPPEEEICGDGLDNDCDGVVDNGCGCTDGETRPCGSNVGICRAGRQTCSDGSWSACEGARWPEPEICDGLDNNCNRIVDEGCECVDGTFQICGSDVGACQHGTQECVGGKWAECLHMTGPADELCDEYDNDCDGETNEDFPDLGEPCEAGEGPCRRNGVMICSRPDGLTTVCSATAGNGMPESCDGVDNDCDGETDEDFANVGEPCEVGIGACARQGSTVCGPQGGTACSVTPGAPTDERCDGLDNDCDGSTDEIFPMLGNVCFSGRGICERQGMWTCLPDGSDVYCDAIPGSGSDESCNNMDDDCDGLTDEDVFQPCFRGDCQGVEACIGGAFLSATCTAPQPDTEACDGVDNDCDGDTDEDFKDGNGIISTVSHCGGCGLRCEPPHATALCESGVCLIDTCEQHYHDLNTNAIDGCEYHCVLRSPPTEICNGSDDDCDGQTDEDPQDTPPDCLDRGVCSNIEPRCSSGSWDCPYPSTYQSVEDRCDNLDNDCDGSTDEGYSGLNQPCHDGEGVCRRYGVIICDPDDAHATTCSAQAASCPAPCRELCDALDNDCDGSTDEEIDVADEMLQVGTGPGSFWIDRWEASRPDASDTSRGFNTAYACAREDVVPWDDITWEEARIACRKRGKHLCTDEQWTRACGGESGLEFPYGDSFDPLLCNTLASSALATGEKTGCASPDGSLDMSGNLAEWAGCERERDCRTVKPFFGGDFDDAIQVMLTCWFRNNAGHRMHLIGLGFRCCCCEECSGDADCDDHDPCTQDLCTDSRCIHTLLEAPGFEGLSVPGSCDDGFDNDCDNEIDGDDSECN
ncbi:MAG: DUF4114 domain-containing protein [Deltaproteobacteria bacterium]|nr:DUF4114 domain-containing protein [Deltaproteobacteria bacterium]